MSLIIDVEMWGYDTTINILTIIVSTVIVSMLLYFFVNRYINFGNKHVNRIINGASDKLNLLISAVKYDLASYLNVNVSDIIYVSATEKLWTDTSLNCLNAIKGKLTDIPEKRSIKGWLIALKYQGYIYEYNANDTNVYVLCNKIEIPNDVSVDYTPTSR